MSDQSSNATTLWQVIRVEASIALELIRVFFYFAHLVKICDNKPNCFIFILNSFNRLKPILMTMKAADHTVMLLAY